ARRRKEASAVGLGQGFTRPKQGLGRHATPVRALAPDELSFDDRERQPAVSKADRDRFSGDATAETDDVKLLCQVSCLREREYSERRASGAPRAGGPLYLAKVIGFPQRCLTFDHRVGLSVRAASAA